VVTKTKITNGMVAALINIDRWLIRNTRMEYNSAAATILINITLIIISILLGPPGAQ
jgi:hypothetical protein